MKNFKKLLALVLATVMVLGTMSMAFAATGDMRTTPDEKVTVTGLTAGDSVKFYKVIEWKGITDSNKDEAANVGGWYAVSPFDTVLTPEVLKEVLIGKEATAADVEAGKATEVGEKMGPQGISSELAGQLARKVGTADVAATVPVTGTSAEYSIPEDGEGMYIAIITPTNVDTVYNPVFVSSDYFENSSDTFGAVETATYSDEAAAKKSTLKIEKTASTTEDTNDDQKSTTTAIGDTVSFTVTTTIPGYGEIYENPTFVLSDTLTNLALKTGTVVVKAEDGYTETLTAGADKDYTIEESTGGYTITFTKTYLESLSVATPIQVKYDAIVTTAAGANVNEEDNQVEINYSHNPADTTGKDLKAKKDTTQHYTFTLDAGALGFDSSASGKRTSEIVKVGVDGAGNPITETRTSSQITEENYQEGPLAQAVFGLYTDESCEAGTEYVPKKADGTSTGTPLTVTSGTDGRMTITGLDAGTYYLKETQAPAGYIKDPSVHTIVITANTKEVTITEWYKVDTATGEVDWKQTETAGYTAYEYKTDVLESYTVTVDGHKAATHWFTNPGTSTEVTWVEDSPGTVEIPQSIVNTKG